MAKRNTDILSEKELFQKTTRMVEHIVGGRIELQYKKGDNFCSYEGLKQDDDKKIYPTFKVNIATPSVRNIGKYTALLHELAHIVYKSPFTKIRDLLNVSAEFEHHNLRYLFGGDFDKILVHNVWNVLEDERIESHLTKYYIDYRKRFDKTLKGIGKNMTQADDLERSNPLFILFCIRFSREDLVKNEKTLKQCKKAMENVRETDPYGSLRVLIELIPIMRDYMNKKNLSNIKSNGNEPEMVKKARNESYSILQPNRVINLPTSRHDIYDENLMPSDLKAVLTYDPHIYDDTYDELIRKGKEIGAELSSNIRQKMLGDGVMDNTPASVVILKRDKTTTPEPDVRTARGLKRVFERIKMKRKPNIDITGDETDLEEYIERRIKGTELNRCKIASKRTNGASIIVSIDASASMRGQRLKTARDLVATLYKSTESLKNVEIRGNIWSSNYEGEIGITEINNYNDVKSITLNDTYFATPSHMAFEYSKRQMKEMKGNKKITFIITDGSPNYYSRGTRLQRTFYKVMCKRKMRDLMKTCPNVYCVVIGNPNPWDVDDIKQAYGKSRVIVLEQLDELNEKVIKQFKEVVMRSI